MIAVEREMLRIGASTLLKEAEATKAAGRSREDVAIAMNDAELCASLALNSCSWNLNPPKTKQRPVSKMRWERIRPSIEFCTTITRPFVSAMMEMIISTAFPNDMSRRTPGICEIDDEKEYTLSRTFLSIPPYSQ